MNIRVRLDTNGQNKKSRNSRLVRISSCSCSVFDALYVLNTLAVSPSIKEDRCLFMKLVCEK